MLSTHKDAPIRSHFSGFRASKGDVSGALSAAQACMVQYDGYLSILDTFDFSLNNNLLEATSHLQYIYIHCNIESDSYINFSE